MVTIKILQTIKITNLKSGRDKIDDIDRRSAELLFQMGETGSIPEWNKLCDERYELKKAKHHIQNQMGKLVKADHVG